MTTAALYCRISLDDLGLGKGVTRQLQDTRELAEQRGWEIVDTYVDNDTSAWSGATREAYSRMMADADAQRFEQIVIWQSSRLWRNRSERSRAIDLLGRLRIGIAAVQGPDLDLTTAYGRMIAGVMGEFDTAESEVKGERVRRAVLQRAQDGLAHGPVAYGWQRVYETNESGRVVGYSDAENVHESTIVREIVSRLLAGDSLRSVTKDLNDRGVPVPSRRAGMQWKPQMVVQVARRTANVGLRVHRGQVIGPAQWPSIVDQDKHDRVVAMLAAPERKQRRDGARRHLLTFGIGACGACGSPLAARSISPSRGHPAVRYPIYHCASAAHCVSRNMAKVDALVAAVVIERLSRPDAAAVFAGDDTAATEARESAAAIRARLDTVADQYADGAIDGEQLRRITAKLRPALEAAEADVRRLRPPSVPDAAEGLLDERAAAVWEALPVTAKRAVLQALGLIIVIHPRKQRGPGFAPEEIEFRWG